jgi:hypothetical protein
LVAIEESDSPVAAVMPKASRMMMMAPSNPAFPTIQGRRRYMITPRMVRRFGVNTPPKVPKSLGPPGPTGRRGWRMFSYRRRPASGVASRCFADPARRAREGRERISGGR